MCLVVATAILIALLFTITIRYLYQGGKMEQIDWDMATVTAGDYTVEFPIEHSSYQNWKNNEYKRPGGPYEMGDSPAHALKLHMASVIEATIDNWVAENHQNVSGIH